MRLGHTIARNHQVGRKRGASHRLSLTPENYIKNNVEYLISSGKIPKYLENEYRSLTTKIFLEAQDLFKNVKLQRIHGDCHFGNILWRDDDFFLVDFDDIVMGPVVQDLWPMIPADDPEFVSKRALLWDAYNEISPLPAHEIKLVPYLRAMRVINYAAWIAKRFEDPAFQNAFINFGTESYWKEQIQILQEISAQTYHNDDEKVFINLDDEPWTPPLDWPTGNEDNE